MNIEPRNVFVFFEEISLIPRGSGNEKQISDYLVAFANAHNLEVYQDRHYNVIIKKDASPGYENLPGVILQGHMDMVCEKNVNVVHDFLKDPIELCIDGDFITANGTTLGSDDGIALALCLAILDSNVIPHPSLEVVFTTDEEVGMNGALSLDCSVLKGKMLINIDSEEENKILTSCAGGLSAIIDLKVVLDSNIEHFKPYVISISGLKGGHSGIDIDKQRGNANKLMGRVLSMLLKKYNMKLVEIWGGGKENAIPRESEAIVLLPSDFRIKGDLENIEAVFKNELNISDSDVCISIKNSGKAITEVFSEESTNKVVTLLNIIPNGIQSMNLNIKGAVESSLNLGTVLSANGHVNFICAIRSSIYSLKYYIKEQLEYIASTVGVDISFKGDYPSWEYKSNSKLRQLFKDTYSELFDANMLETTVHAGLECGVFAEKIGNIDIVSIGPNAYDIHTPDEKLSISSTRRIWELILNTLKNMKYR